MRLRRVFRVGPGVAGLLGALMLTVPGTTRAQGDPNGAWRAFSAQGAAFVLPPEEPRKILLMASVGPKGPFLSLLDLEGSLCTATRSSDAVALRPSFSVNGKPLSFVEDCVNGTVVERPGTDQGQAYLRSLVAADSAVTIDDGRGAVLHYPNADFRPVQQELQLRAYGF